MRTKFLSNIISKGAGLGPRQIRVRASDTTVDRVGDVLEAAGADLSDFRRNPIVLFNHNPGEPIGTASLSRNGNAIEGVITFAPEGASQKSDEACSLAKAGVLSVVSVGFDPIEALPYPLGFRITKWALLEVSLCAIPCNPSATVLERSYGSSKTSSGAPFALSRAARMAEIAAYQDAAPSAPPKMSARSAYVISEEERVLGMSTRLYDSDHEANRARRIVEAARLRR